MTNPSDNTIFISRTDADKAVAVRIAGILRGAGYKTVIQDEDFGHTSFMAMMHDTLASGARVAAILSDDYLKKPNCNAEWQAALTGDPQNKQQRLIVFRVAECNPTGLLKPIPYVNLLPMLGDPMKLAETVRNAVRRGAGNKAGAPGALIDREVNWQVPSFTGREDALADLRNALFNQTGVAAVTQPAVAYGMGGIGKSALAKEYAWRERETYSILWWLNAEKEDGIVDGLIRLGAHYIPDLDKEQDRTKAAKAALANVFSTLDNPALLVFDNLEDQALLRKWKPIEHCHVLVTSRLHGWGGDVARVDISKWPPDDARDYLLKESGRDDLKPEDSERIAKALDYLPLALAHTAAVLRDNPAMTADRYLERIEQHMDRAPAGAEYPRAVFATFQEALAQAETRAPGAAAILCLAAFYAPDDIPFELFEQKADVYPDDLAPTFENGSKAASLRAAVSDPNVREQALSALASLSLIALKNETRSFSVHRLVQAACRDLCGAEREIWVETAVVVADAAFPNVEFENWPLCARLTPHAEAVAAHAPDAAESLSRLLNEAGVYLRQRAQYLRTEQLSRRALAIGEKSYGPNHPNVAAILSNLAGLLCVTNRPAEAEPLYRRALAINEKAYGLDQPEVAIALNNLAELLRDTHRLAQAEPLYRRALSIGEKTLGPDHPRVAIRLSNLALLLDSANRYVEAEPLYRRALAIDERVYGPDYPSVATKLNNLAGLFFATKRFAEAEPLYRRALAINEKVYGPEHPEVGTDLSNLAAFLWNIGRFAEAVPMMERAAAILRVALGDDHPHTKFSMAALEQMRRELEESGKKASPKGKRKR
jgi:tetratricopeptide (TPR) repeat protein